MDRSMKKQFVASLRKWTQNKDVYKEIEDPDDLIGSLENISWLYEDEDDVFKVAFRALLFQKAMNECGTLRSVALKCESPIELAMLYALTIEGRIMGRQVIYLVDGSERGDRLLPGYAETLCIEPQAQLGDYRVDFLLTLTATGPDLKNMKNHPDFQEKLIYKTICKKMVLECDGHDFHDRSKEQARKDRARDRALQSVGYRVYRYTGSEIWADVFKCAHEALSTLENEVSEEDAK